MGYTHLPKRPDTINSNPNMIRAIASKSTAVATPSGGYKNTTKPTITAMMPTTIIPGVARAMATNPKKINASPTSHARVNPPQMSGETSIAIASRNTITDRIKRRSRCHPEMPSEKIRANSTKLRIKIPTARKPMRVAAAIPGYATT